MQKGRIKTIIPIAVVLLFLGIAISPGISAEEPEPREITNIISVWMPGVTKDDYSAEVELTQEQLDKVNNSIQNLYDTLLAARDENSLEGETITETEWEDIRQSAYIILYFFEALLGEDFPLGEAKSTICQVISNLISPLFWLRQPIFSVGFGITWIPFYDYETFLGKLLRPVWIRHFLGCSISIRPNPFPPIIPYCKKGFHKVRSMFFIGLMINFGKLGFERRIGPQLLVGYGFTGMTN